MLLSSIYYTNNFLSFLCGHLVIDFGHVDKNVVLLGEGEGYYLRLLLTHVGAPTSYKDLVTVDGEHCTTFRESVEKRELLYCDNTFVDCMSEAASYQMPHSLRRLFATLLVYCAPANPRKLWEQFEDFNA